MTYFENLEPKARTIADAFVEELLGMRTKGQHG